MSSMFERATRKKYRFPSSKGGLTVEQLWDLPLIGKAACLNAVAIEVNTQLKAVTEESFVQVKPNPIKGELERKLEIVKHIIAVKMTEKDRAEKRVVRAERRRELLDALAAKDAQELTKASREDILKELASLEA